MLGSKSRLAIELSKLKVFEDPDPHSEQYPTDSEIAADMLWKASFNEEIPNHAIADLGAGTGILGIGALLMDAKKVYFVEKDPKAIELLKQNLDLIRKTHEIKGGHEIFQGDINEFNVKVDLVIQNPPFGTRKEHADREFLLKAFTISPTIISFHKAVTKKFIEKIAEDNHYKITHYWEYDLPIKATQLFHKRAIHRIKVGCWRMVSVKLDTMRPHLTTTYINNR